MVATQDVYDVVRSSPAAVAAHDKEGWIALFDTDYVIEDPVGWRPVRGGDISAFWDAFIAPNDIRFDVHHDWIDGLHVVRDVTVVTTSAPGCRSGRRRTCATSWSIATERSRSSGWQRTGRSCRTSRS